MVGSFTQRTGRRPTGPVTITKYDPKGRTRRTTAVRKFRTNSFNGICTPLQGYVWVGIASNPGGIIDTVRKVYAK